MDQICLFHINDSKSDYNSGLDRHENIGQGRIGLDGFKALVNHHDLKNIPLILEVPGFDKQGPDKKNVDIVKGLINK